MDINFPFIIKESGANSSRDISEHCLLKGSLVVQYLRDTVEG